MKQNFEKWVEKVDAMSLRERVLIFAALVFMLISLFNSFLLDPLLAKQKKFNSQIVQRQEKIKEIRAQLDALVKAEDSVANSPLRKQLIASQQQLEDSESYLKNLQNRLVAPEMMADLLQKMLARNGQLELVSLQSLPVMPLIPDKTDSSKKTGQADISMQVYTHRVKITVRGTYRELLQYLTMLEHLPTQMFWGNAKMTVEKQVTVELTLMLYTLSLDKTWLQI